MATIQQEIMNIAEAQGYEGDAPQTIAEAVNALGTVMGGGGSGGGGGGMVIHATGGGDTLTTDVTYEQVAAYIEAGNYDAVVIHDHSMGGFSNAAYTLGNMESLFDSSVGSRVTTYAFYNVAITTSMNKTELVAQVITMAPSGTTFKTARGTLGS